MALRRTDRKPLDEFRLPRPDGASGRYAISVRAAWLHVHAGAPRVQVGSGAPG